MFRQIFSKTCTFIQLRNYARRLQEVSIDPGIKRRRNILPNYGDEPESFDIDEYDTDFSNLADVYDENAEEVKRSKELLHYRIVKRKYFQSKLPNFLLWSEKEQIRLMHQKNQTEHSPDSLTHSFPALPETISKIIKAKWSPKNQNRIKNHDENVLKNWKQFRNGELNNLPKDLIAHLKKFSNRPEKVSDEVHDLSTQRTKPTVNVITPGKTEFRNIIRDYKSKLKAITSGQSDVITGKNGTETEVIAARNREFFSKNVSRDNENQMCTLNKNIRISRKEVSLDQLRNNLLQNSHKLRFNEKLFLNQLSQKTEEINSSLKPVEVTSIESSYTKFKTSEVVSYEAPRLISYPNKIRIPKNKWKRDATYKLNDCFYDSNGYFLYRVIGL